MRKYILIIMERNMFINHRCVNVIAFVMLLVFSMGILRAQEAITLDREQLKRERMQKSKQIKRTGNTNKSSSSKKKVVRPQSGSSISREKESTKDIQSNRPAPYLRVEGVSYVYNQTVPAEGGEYTLNVSTNNKLWHFSATKSYTYAFSSVTNSSVILKFNPNKDYDEREYEAYVESDTLRTYIIIKQEGNTSVKGSIISSKRLYDSKSLNESKMYYLARIRVEGPPLSYLIVADFTCNGEPVRLFEKSSRVWCHVTPFGPSANQYFKPVISSIPLNAFSLSKGTHKIRCRLRLYSDKLGYVDGFESYFWFKIKKGKNKIKSLSF